MNTRALRALGALATVLAVVATLPACADDPADARSLDAATADANRGPDGGDDAGRADLSGLDLGEVDATPVDAGGPDAADPDAGTPDQGPDAQPPPVLTPLTECTTAGPLDDTLRYNQLWYLGTHNSYHVQSEVVVHRSHRYTQPPLTAQFNLGVRQLELDLHLRVGGGFEVFHLPRVDEQTTCRRFVDCLAEVRTWSAAHPCHAPILIWLEPKDEDLDVLDPTLASFLDKHEQMEAEILSVWPRERIFTPDDLRGAHATLPEAIAAEGWPTLGALRGKVVFSMLDSSNHRAAYLGLTPGDAGQVLTGRLLFVGADDVSDPFAALFKINDAAGEAARVQAVTDAGFMVTSNTGSTEDAQVVPEAGRPGEPAWAHFDASLSAAPHCFSSDFVVPHPETGFVTVLPGGSPGCHPRLAPSECTAEAVEPAEIMGE